MSHSPSLLDEVRLTRRMPSPRAARLIRQAAGVTQARMADELGVHRVTFARWEAGTSKPGQHHRVRYAQLLADLQREVAS